MKGVYSLEKVRNGSVNRENGWRAVEKRKYFL